MLITAIRLLLLIIMMHLKLYLWYLILCSSTSSCLGNDSRDSLIYLPCTLPAASYFEVVRIFFGLQKNYRINLPPKEGKTLC